MKKLLDKVDLEFDAGKCKAECIKQCLCKVLQLCEVESDQLMVSDPHSQEMEDFFGGDDFEVMTQFDDDDRKMLVHKFKGVKVQRKRSLKYDEKLCNVGSQLSKNKKVHDFDEERKQASYVDLQQQVKILNNRCERQQLQMDTSSLERAGYRMKR